MRSTALPAELALLARLPGRWNTLAAIALPQAGEGPGD
jgi:hypothetical protein